MLDSHFFTLLVFSTLVSVFFACLTRETLREALKVGSAMLAAMIGVSLLLAYVMYLFPLG